MNDNQFNALSNAFYDKFTEMYSKKPNIDYERMKDDCVSWIKGFVKSYGNDKTAVVIGMSGGKDSTVVAKLLVEALGSERVYGLIMPNGEMADIDDARKACEVAGIKYDINNIGLVYEAACDAFLSKTEKPNAKVATNLPSRIRMSMLYAFAATYNNGNCFVVNTSNFAERLIGYGTLWGDTVGDFAPIAKMFVNDVISIGYVLGIPSELLIKAPADGMTGKTDEDVLGFTYDEVEETYKHLFDKSFPKTPNFNKIKERIYKMQWKMELTDNVPSFGYLESTYLGD